MNRAMLLNYYRFFEKAKPAWEQVLVKNTESDVQDGLGVALQGLGTVSCGPCCLCQRLRAGGAASGRFVAVYHDAARLAWWRDPMAEPSA